MRYLHDTDHLAKNIRQGHGQAIQILREMTDDERRGCMDIIVNAACNDLRYDRQCDADRTQYIFDMLDSFRAEDREIMKTTIISKWREVLDAKDLGLTQYSRVIDRFADEGADVGEIRDKLKNAISQMFGEPERGEQHIGRKPDEILTIDRVIEIVRATNGTVIPVRFKRFFQKATADDVNTLLEAARNESDPVIKAKLYSLFSQTDFAGDAAELISAAKAWEEDHADESGSNAVNTGMFLYRALARLRDPLVREYGFELIERGMAAESESEKAKLIGYGMNIWAKNYEEEDCRRVFDLYVSLPDRENDPYEINHTVDFAITHNMFDRKFSDPRTYGHLVWIIDNTFCSSCRKQAVQILSEHGMLQTAVREYCLLDCDTETRMIAENTKPI